GQPLGTSRHIDWKLDSDLGNQHEHLLSILLRESHVIPVVWAPITYLMSGNPDETASNCQEYLP
ncbi:hypothetical protein, partial [Nocardioides hungaricus]